MARGNYSFLIVQVCMQPMGGCTCILHAFQTIKPLALYQFSFKISLRGWALPYSKSFKNATFETKSQSKCDNQLSWPLWSVWRCRVANLTAVHLSRKASLWGQLWTAGGGGGGLQLVQLWPFFHVLDRVFFLFLYFQFVTMQMSYHHHILLSHFPGLISIIFHV